MKWSIPAKTFIFGEYAALVKGSAMLVTTAPCFELSLTEEQSSSIIFHPQSPAGRFISAKLPEVYFNWTDPYEGQGGLGASSAQFIGAYLAWCDLKGQTPTLKQLLSEYHAVAWDKETGKKPSGYDVLAQTGQHCVFLEEGTEKRSSSVWPFPELGFILLRTGQKQATHEHLKGLSVAQDFDCLVKLAREGMQAILAQNSSKFLQTIQAYHETLRGLDLLSPNSLEAINRLKSDPDFLAIKGCGALGADILLVLVSKEQFAAKKRHLSAQAWTIVATHENLYQDGALIT